MKLHHHDSNQDTEHFHNTSYFSVSFVIKRLPTPIPGNHRPVFRALCLVYLRMFSKGSPAVCNL